MLASIREARKHADLVISYHHNHIYDRDFALMMMQRMPERHYPPQWVRKLAREQIRAGVDVVVMHGAPIVQGVEIHLGNFIFQLPTRSNNVFGEEVWTSVTANLGFAGKRLKAISFTPILLNQQGVGEGVDAVATRGLPGPASGDKARQILDDLVERSRPFGTSIRSDGQTARSSSRRGGRADGAFLHPARCETVRLLLEPVNVPIRAARTRTSHSFRSATPKRQCSAQATGLMRKNAATRS